MKDYARITRELGEGMEALGRVHPAAMGAFGDLLDGTTGADGALDRRTKELIAFAIGIAARCDGCIGHHAKAVAAAGASRAEVAETIGVAILMGGGPSVVYGCEALKAYDGFVRDEGADEPFAAGSETIRARA